MKINHCTTIPVNWKKENRDAQIVTLQLIMTDTDIYKIREVDAPDYFRYDTKEVFTCECGNETRATNRTECKQCGAHYARGDDPTDVMIQLAPPIPTMEEDDQ